MNLHLTNDTYGLYPVEIAERIKGSSNRNNNMMVNLSETSVLKDEIISYIRPTRKSFKEYIKNIQQLDKIIFHPYDLTGYKFLTMLLKKFPAVKVYWVCWSYELFNLPHVVHELYEPFSANYVLPNNSPSKKYALAIRKNLVNVLNMLKIKRNYLETLKHSYSLVHYFCATMPSDFIYLQKISSNNKISYLPFAYLSLNKIMPDLDKFRSVGNKLMIGHSSSPDGNHYEIIQKISSLANDHPVFLPLAYGSSEYGSIIKQEAQKKFKDLEVLEEKLERTAYYQKLTEVGWAIINVKVQQGFGNIMALIWMGAKVFLDKNSNIYKDFCAWGIKVFNIQDDLNKAELSNRLNFEQVENNRKIILGKLNDDKVDEYWDQILY